MNKNLLLSILIFGLIHQTARSQDEWELRKDKNGIRVYSRSSDIIPFDELKAETILAFSPETLLNVMLDIKNYPEWVSDVESARLLSREGDTAQTYYSVIGVPFPFEDRDVVYYNTFQFDENFNSLVITIEAVNDVMNEQDDYVRMSFGKGKWTAKKTDEGHSSVSLQMLADPGGNIPAWLVNKFIVDSPFNTLSNLKEFGKKEQYQ
ncbi:MAG: START domain-containing protein [Bacteroidales bacterium]|nr:START domain-containing protein [Bacteroidales bacterium]